MGAANELFARNVEFEATFPELGANELARNRHGDRLGLLKPDPQVISRQLFTPRVTPAIVQRGLGLPGDSTTRNATTRRRHPSTSSAAFWIQFMTHDWFSHLDDGHNAPGD